MKRLTFLLSLTLFLIACQAVEPDEPTPTPDLETVGPVTVIADDGTPLAAEFLAAGTESRPSVLLVHMVGSSRRAWDEFVLQLASNGYNVLTFDMRGHGETGGETDWEASVGDVQTLYNYMLQRPETDPNRTAIVGASIGANLALVAAAAEPAVGAVVALSPGLDYQGIEPLDAMSEMGGTPVLLVASSEDAYAFESAQSLNEAGPTTQWVPLDDVGHGTEMLGNAPTLTLAILTWLGSRLQ